MEYKELMKAPITTKKYQTAQDIIPGAVQLFSKKPELHAPGAWPAYYNRAEGCEVWDLDDNHYYDFATNGIGACLLGYNSPEVSNAAKRAIDQGCMSTLNVSEEVTLAERLCEIHPWASMARFCRTGGEAMAIAVRIARASTNRSMVAVCGYHGWHDWYLAANLGEDSSLDGHLLPGLTPLGVPKELAGTTQVFAFNDVDALKDVLNKHGSRLAAIVMEPCRHHLPDPEFINLVRKGADDCGAVLIFDEISIGWRLCYGGAHLSFGVNPDIAVFAKALGNGHPIGAIIGKSEVMASAEYSFISSTYWTERVGPAAALAVLDEMEKTDVPAYIAEIGDAVKKIWHDSAAIYDISLNIDDGFSCFASFAFVSEEAQELKTLFSQYMLDEGFLAGTGFYPTMAHNTEIVNKYGEAVKRVFKKLAQHIKAGKVKNSMKGSAAQKNFARLVK